MSEPDIIAAEHIIASAYYKSKDWTNVYLVPVVQYRALAERLAVAEEQLRQAVAVNHVFKQSNENLEQKLAASEQAAKLCDALCAILQPHVGETGVSEGAVRRWPTGSL